MDEYISRHEAIRAVQLSYGNYEATRKAIFELPAADVAPVRRGRWALNKKYGDYECSECGQGDVKAMDFTNLKMRYCPNCGAKMDGAE
nr:MAG TPA: hydrogenase/urease nickel incorporation protein [Caudoviricetes sp.]